MGPNADLPSDSGVSRAVRVNIVFTAMLFRKYSMSFLMICSLIDFSLVVLKLLMFKVSGIIRISKIKFFNFPDTERADLLMITLTNKKAITPFCGFENSKRAFHH